jgi:hypothetical protein
VDFFTSVKSPRYFSDKKFFNSVFVAGGDAEKELEDYRKSELEKWTKKLVVASPTFKVNTIVSAHSNVDKYKTIL